jgi:hypothetical protein
MATNYKAYENEDGTVQLVKEGSLADQNYSSGTDEPTDVPGLSSTVADDGSAEPVVAVSSFARVRNTGQGGVNLEEPTRISFEPRLEFVGAVESDWTAAEGGIIANFSGIVEVSGQINFWVAGTSPQRSTPHLKATLDGEPGPSVSKHGYIRAASGHNNSTVFISELFRVREGQIIGLTSQQGTVAGEVGTEGGQGSLLVKRLR